MNLNYNNLNLDNFSEEVKQKYSFPEDKELLSKIFKENLIGAKDESYEKFYMSTYRKWLFASGLLFVGTYSYCRLLMPAGKVIRDRIDSQRTWYSRAGRRILPFLCIAIPIAMLRDAVESPRSFK